MLRARINTRNRSIRLAAPTQPRQVHLVQLCPSALLRQPFAHASTITKSADYARSGTAVSALRGAADLVPHDAGAAQRQGYERYVCQAGSGPVRHPRGAIGRADWQGAMVDGGTI